MVLKYKLIAISTVLIILLGTILGLYKQNNTLKDKLDVAVTNEKALLRDNTSWRDKYGKLNTSVIEMQLSFKGLENTNDSLLLKINDYAKKANIKKPIGGGIITGTIDTVFRTLPGAVSATIDTCVQFGDDWLGNEVCVRDGVVTSKIHLTNEQVLFWENKRETIEPRRKFFLRRWFQRKHTIVQVTVVNGNPYIKQQKTKFVNFVK